MTVDLGGEQVELQRIECSEAMGQPFTLVVDIVATLGEIDVLPHLGKPIAVTLRQDGEVKRHFHGLVTDSDFLHESRVGFHYRLTARPFTHFLAQNRAMAIFQDQSALDIIKKVFADAGASDVDYTKISGSYAPRSYCVQYRESDFIFVTRLMEEEGLYYYWKHEADRHTMIVCDAATAHAAGVPASLPYNANPSRGRVTGAGGSDVVAAWNERVSTAGQQKVTLRDFDFEKPQQPVEAVTTGTAAHPNDAREVFHYPAGFVDTGRGGKLGAARLEGLRRDRKTYSGVSAAAGLACGTKLTLQKHPVGRLNADYLITATFHTIVAEKFRSQGSSENEMEQVRLDAIPADTPFRLDRATRRPVVEGLETAIVSGPSSDVVFTDEYGRVKVRFHWDRSGTADDKSTCWIRVAQFGGLGNVILPRIGQEVMVGFLNGDPDRPIVMGWTFNNALKPIYPLPANKTRSLWRTQRIGQAGSYPNAKSLDSGEPGANELRFEDKGGAEEVFLHAERDMNTRIRLGETHHVGATQDINIGYDRTDEVGNDETTKIGQNQKLTVGSKQTEEIGADRTIEVKASDTLKVGTALKVSAGTTIEISANTSVTLKCGPSTIEMTPGGITIKGLQIKIEGQATAEMSSIKTDVKGAAMVTVNGGIVMIN